MQCVRNWYFGCTKYYSGLERAVIEGLVSRGATSMEADAEYLEQHTTKNLLHDDDNTKN